MPHLPKERLTGAWRQGNEPVCAVANLAQIVENSIKYWLAVDRGREQALYVFHNECGGHQRPQNADVFLVQEMPAVLAGVVTLSALVARPRLGT